MQSPLRRLRNFFVSLELTVVLLVMSIVLIFVATLDQVNLGIWAVQQKYFRSFFVWWSTEDGHLSIPLFPGGYLIGGFLLTNLIAAHVYRFKLTWEKVGIQLAHAGLILLLIGELITGLIQRDSVMELTEGSTKNYSQSFREYELALIDHSNPDYDEVVAIPDAVLAGKQIIQHPKLPFLVRVQEFHPNATLHPRDANSPAVSAGTTGPAARFAFVSLPLSYKENEPNLPGARIELTSTGGPLGTWLLSPQISMPQTFTAAGHTWSIALRIRRHYQPFSVTLLKVTHEIYPGTDIPKNFASRVRVKSDDGHEDRETTIFMNNPLRFGGLTFYQYQMDAATQMSAFQVVSNPGWLLPYIACVMMALGLIWQFLASLGKFINRRSGQTNS